MPPGRTIPPMQHNRDDLPIIEPYNAYSARASDGTITTKYYYRDVHCDRCEEATCAHDTCENCGFHGDFDEFGEGAACPKCCWGYPN